MLLQFSPETIELGALDFFNAVICRAIADLPTVVPKHQSAQRRTRLERIRQNEDMDGGAWGECREGPVPGLARLERTGQIDDRKRGSVAGSSVLVGLTSSGGRSSLLTCASSVG